MSTEYAIIESGGKQYRAEAGESLLVDRLRAEEGDKVTLRPVMFRGDDVVLGADDLEKVKVEAVVTEHLRGKKIQVFKYKAKKGFRRRQGHRSELTRLEVKEVKLLSRKPAAKKTDEAPAAEAKVETKPATETKPAAKKPAAKKPAAKKPAAAAKKPAAKKPAAKKPAAKKPAAKKEDS
ncbi:hypothetical protein BH10ACT11_BH10ACT11_06140 [soil metagenome]